MQVVYEGVLKIQFASRKDLGLISISQISLRIKGHFRYSRLSETSIWIFQPLTRRRLEPRNLLEDQLPHSYVSANKSAC